MTVILLICPCCLSPGQSLMIGVDESGGMIGIS